MSTKSLGRLEKVELHEAWTSEAAEFTPWLAQEENLRLLGKTIGLELELEAQEKNVGPFRADILCKNTATDEWVLIENQLERTDHTHLGQLMTYAAGLKAVTVVWIARQFTDEHRAALDWLNEITDQRFNFFGLEIELLKISDSPFAPRFNVVCQPNDWVRYVQTTAATEQSEVKLLQQEFFIALRDYLNERSFVRGPKALPKNWYGIAVGRSGFLLAAVVNSWDTDSGSETPGGIRAEFVIDDRQYAKQYFAALEADKDAIEREAGEPLIWDQVPGRLKCKIILRRSADIRRREAWPEYHEWLRLKLEALHRAFVPRIARLTVPLPEMES